MSPVETASNIDQVIMNISKRGVGLQDVYETRITNNVEYAVAVDKGYTRKAYWAQMSRKQRAAIIIAMKKGKERKTDAQVNRFDGGFEIIMPPAGMIAKSRPAIRQLCTLAMARLPKAFGDSHLQAKIAEMGKIAEAIIVTNTPVDKSRLVQGWEAK